MRPVMIRTAADVRIGIRRRVVVNRMMNHVRVPAVAQVQAARPVLPQAQVAHRQVPAQAAHHLAQAALVHRPVPAHPRARVVVHPARAVAHQAVPVHLRVQVVVRPVRVAVHRLVLVVKAVL